MPLNPNPFDPATGRVYMPYVIYSHNASQVAAWRAIYGYGIIEGPAQAAATLGIPFPPAGPLTDHGIFYTYPFVPDFKIPLIVDPLEQFPDPAQDWFELTGRFAPDGSQYPTVAFTWIGIFQQMGSGAGDTYPPDAGPLPAVNMSMRRWVEGFEQVLGDRNVENDGTRTIRASSRTADGFGLAMRTGSSSRVGNHAVMTDIGGGLSNRDWSWERLYMRVRKFPTAAAAEIAYYRTQQGGSEGAEGIKLFLDIGGRLDIYSINNSSLETLRAAGPTLPLDEWVKLDIIVGFTGTSTVANPGRFGTCRIYVNGVAQVTSGPFSIINQVRTNLNFHSRTELGEPSSHDAEVDFDDWIGCDMPTELPDPGAGNRAPDYTTLEAQYDFLAGSHVQRVQATGFGPNHSVNWTTNYRALAQRPGTSTSSAAPTFQAITSTTSGARAEIETTLRVDDPNFWTDIYQLGSPGFMVSAIVQIASAAGGGATEGYKIGAAADVGANYGAATGKIQGIGPLYRPTGILIPAAIDPLLLFYTKTLNGSADGIYSLSADIELLGGFGPEDALSPDAPVVRGAFAGIHNAPYTPAMWSAFGPSPLSPIVVQTGTFSGNNISQDISLVAPPHWVFIRRVGSAQAPVLWHSGQLCGHLASSLRCDPHTVQLLYLEDTLNDELIPTLRIAGADAALNATGGTYRYISISDPGQRFMTNGAVAHNADLATAINALLDATFSPEAGFFQGEGVASASGTNSQYYKGPGNAANSGSLINSTSAETANVATFGTPGQFTSRVALHASAWDQFGYSLLRTIDGSGEVGRVVFQIFSYTGDGVSPRVINCTPASGRRPLYALVVPVNATARVYRDPSHAGTNSSQYSTGTEIATGIIAGGIDAFTVQSALNANGVVYNVLVIPGGTIDGGDGWSDTDDPNNPDLPGVFIPGPPVNPGPNDPDAPDDPVPEEGESPIPPIAFENAQRLKLTYVDSVLYFDYEDTDGVGQTLVFEPKVGRWMYDVYGTSGVTARLAEPGPGIHTNLMGRANGHIYQASVGELTDDGTTLDWALWTPWEFGDDPRAYKQWGDAMIDVVGGGGMVVTPVMDFGATTLPTTAIASGTARLQRLVELNAGIGTWARNLGLRLAGSLTSAATARPVLYLWEPAFIPKAAGIARRATDWDDLGYKGAKFVQGVIIRANTFNVAKQVEVQYDGGTVAETLELQHSGEIARAYPIDPYGWQPFVAELVRLQGADAVEWALLDWRWIWEPAPETATQWETQETTFNLPGFLSVHDCLIAYISDEPVTLTVWHDTGSQSHVLPDTGGVYLRYYQRLTAAKGKWARFRLTSDAPFRLFARDTSVRVQGWGLPGGFQIVQPFGGPHREVGAQI